LHEVIDASIPVKKTYNKKRNVYGSQKKLEVQLRSVIKNGNFTVFLEVTPIMPNINNAVMQ